MPGVSGGGAWPRLEVFGCPRSLPGLLLGRPGLAGRTLTCRGALVSHRGAGTASVHGGRLGGHGTRAAAGVIHILIGLRVHQARGALKGSKGDPEEAGLGAALPPEGRLSLQGGEGPPPGSKSRDAGDALSPPQVEERTVAWLPRALTWEGGTRSKFFPSILRMCFRAWEVIWCLRRKENWQPSRMQWKWLFTWLYLQPVDTARPGVSAPRRPTLTAPAARQLRSGHRGSVANRADGVGDRARSPPHPWGHSSEEGLYSTPPPRWQEGT